MATKALQQPPKTAAPSFDCSYAATWSELAICDSSELALLDLRLDAAYRSAREALEAAAFEKLRLEQAQWLSVRDECGVLTSEPARHACLTATIEERILYLLELAGG